MNFCSQETYLFGSLTHEHEPLRIGDDFGCVKCLLKIVDEKLLIAAERFFGRATDNFAGADTLLLDRGQASGKYSFADECD